MSGNVSNWRRDYKYPRKVFGATDKVRRILRFRGGISCLSYWVGIRNLRPRTCGDNAQLFYNTEPENARRAAMALTMACGGCKVFILAAKKIAASNNGWC